MASDPNAPRSRRALLTAAAGAAGAVAATAALPLTAVAANNDPVLAGNANASTAETSLDDSGDRTVGFKASNAGVAPALIGWNAAGVATDPPVNPGDPPSVTSAAGVYGVSADGTGAAAYRDTTFTGVYGWAPTLTDDVPFSFAAGVWGDSEDVGTYGFGTVGVRGDGFIGVVGAGPVGGVGVRAWGNDGTGGDVALQVYGKVQFSRAGRATIGAGKSGIKVNMVGVSASSRVFAVLHSNRAGRFVRAVVPTTGSFTIYLNTTVTSSTYVAFFVIN